MHESGCFVLPNPWDIGTAIYLERLGFKALATTSAGFAFSRGKSDGAVPRDEMLAHIREIVAATALPVNADFMAGYADVVLTGRCEAWLVGDPNPLHTALDRLTAYAEAGADCLYAPGVSNPDEIAQIVKKLAPKSVNILVSGFNHQLSMSQLANLGVRRVSVGSGLALAAWGAFLRAAQDIKTNGSFTLLANNAPSADLNELFREKS